MIKGFGRTSRWFNLLYSLLALLMLMALFTFGYATWIDVKGQAVESLEPHNKTLTQVIERFFNHQETLLTDLAADLRERSTTREDLSGRLNDFLQATPQMRVLAVLDRRGTVIAATGDLSATDWLDLYESDDSVIGRPFRPSFVGENVLPLRAPIFDDMGRPNGYVVAAYRMLGNNTIWQEAEESEAGRRSMLVGEDGRIYLAFPETETLWQSFLSFTVTEPFLDTLSSITNPEAESSAKVNYQDEDLLITASHLDKYQMFVVSALPSHDLYQRWLERMKFVALTVLIFLGAGLLVFRNIFSRASRVEVARNEAESNVSKLSQAIEQSPSSVVVTDSHWVIEYANSRLGIAGDDPRRIEEGRRLTEVFPHTVLAGDLSLISENLQHGNNWYGERRAREEKQWYSFSVSSMTDDLGHITNYVIIAQDITERKKAEVKLYKQANYDSLTGLPNRRRTNDLLAEKMKTAWKQDGKVAILYMDMDNFKQVNDTFGHLLGDQLLKYVAAQLQKVVGSAGTACHMSGDEFLIFMEFEEKYEVTAMAEALLAAMREPVFLDGKKLFTSVSVGISCFPEDSAEPEGVLKQADIALYEAKNRGRSCYSFFDHELDERNKRLVEIQSELRNALERKELFMVYQTKNHIHDERVYGFEALMRWNSGKLGMVRPDEFIEVAEDIGIIDQLGEFALVQACADLQRFESYSSEPLTMAVNVSMRQLTNSDIIATVSRVLNESGLEPAKLELEITESLLAESMEELQPILNGLLQLGVTLSIDDFGTGYSSLSYLTRFPVSTLKIDRCFVTNIVSNKSDATLTHTVVGMAHKLGLKVVAEGIEDADQLALLRVYGCDIGQGYFFTKPLEFVDMVEHLKQQQPQPDWAI
ncbi:EAL domain-containing protein [Neptunomonas marina]|uniref:EAL domain-containing protein n=1 Tax=Neptunomonas marina TaxID=1815562 RepID=A0A437Q966_9GAMM|nr:EAL domain-containing protein [Neptunomonas marina]RVU31124.1 EAL domain-containing protein [Neptunomonas marina]